ncbi:MAG: hypothetical protein Q9218_008148 [Villophora microphyllina]
MRKSFTLLQHYLDPTTIFFLGDLFDGGREWMPPGSSNTDPRWRNYGEEYWVKEYKRFGSIFFDSWLQKRETQGTSLNDHRRILAGLPGNHDLGLGKGIRLPVRQRFNAFFGDGNHIDVVGNHTFVSVDTVSLSAKGQIDPATGRQGAAEGEGSNQEIWGPVEDFLTNLKNDKPRVKNRAVRIQNARVENDLMLHDVLDINSTLVNKSVHTAYTSKVHLPSILLSHVPLYRAKDTPCGPLRERSPPSTKPNESGEYLDKDPPNAIRVEAGIQYQNVLTPEISSELIDKIGDVEYAFSGDDHDYCEVVHRGYTSPRGGIREITVKSFSWAMGVRKPGFLLVSLWNPLDDKERIASYPRESHGHFQQHATMQTHLCLLPDQLAVFVRYAGLLVFTLVSLLIRAVEKSRHGERHNGKPEINGHTLPLSSKTKIEPLHSRDSSTVTSHNTQSNGLASRTAASGRAKTASPRQGYGYPAPSNNPSSLHDDDPLDERWSEMRVDDDDSKRKHGFGARVRFVGREFGKGVLMVGIPVGMWYAYLVRRY